MKRRYLEQEWQRWWRWSKQPG